MKFGRADFTRTLSVISIATVAGVVAIFLTSEEPIAATASFFFSVFTNEFYFGNFIAGAVPLIFTGLAASIAFSSASFNLGLEGQVYLGAFVGVFVGVKLGEAVPGFLAVPVVLLSGFLAGGLLAGLSGLLKGFKGVNELISSFLLGNGFVLLVDYFVETPFNDRASGLAASYTLDSKFKLSRILLPSNLHTGLFIALAAVAILWFFLFKTRPGYDFLVTGKDPKFAYYGGINTRGVYFWSMFLSGGLAATGGVIDVIGVHARVLRGFSAGYGWNGIAVALIARNHPLLVVPSALLFAYLESGAQIASFEVGLTPELAKIVQSIIFYLVTAQALFSFFKGGSKVV